MNLTVTHFFACCALLTTSYLTALSYAADQNTNIQMGGQPVLTATRTRSGEGAQFLSIELLPGRGMNTFQIRAYVPGTGEVDLLQSPSVEEAQQKLSGGPDDKFGNAAFGLGGAFLVPYANRIRGKLAPDGQGIEATIMGRTVSLPANWKGKNPGAELHSMHGLILASKMDKFSSNKTADGGVVTALVHAGDFGGHWLSQTDLNFKATLSVGAIDLEVTARNVGKEPEPMGIGWHPWFAILSGDRTQAKLHIPAKMRVEVNNYDDVFPSGKLLPTAGTDFDFTAAAGKTLAKQYLDDNFTDLQRSANGAPEVTLADPAAKYGLRVIALSRQILAFQVYAPPEKPVVAIEPQFNLVDPFNPAWGKTNTGMVTLKPGQSVTYHVRLELFTP
ncbi:MAG TPA: aldose 1-epimerase [Terriglobales bacterium]|nr:aldose 1-epimerase [Terriglobales bacterium]